MTWGEFKRVVEREMRNMRRLSADIELVEIGTIDICYRPSGEARGYLADPHLYMGVTKREQDEGVEVNITNALLFGSSEGRNATMTVAEVRAALEQHGEGRIVTVILKTGEIVEIDGIGSEEPTLAPAEASDAGNERDDSVGNERAEITTSPLTPDEAADRVRDSRDEETGEDASGSER